MSLAQNRPNHANRRWSLPCLSLLLIGLLAGCSLSQPNPDQTTWLVSPERTGDATHAQTPASKITLKMGSFSANPPFDGKSLVYRLSDNRYERDFYNQYLIYPRDMVANATRQWLSKSGSFNMIVEEPTTYFPMYQLQGVIDEFYGDYRGQPTAVVSIQFYASGSFIVTQDQGIFSAPRISRRIPLKDKSTEALIAGEQQALSEILQELETRLVADSAKAPVWHDPLAKPAAVVAH